MKITAMGNINLKGAVRLTERPPLFNIVPDYFFSLDNLPTDDGFQQYTQLSSGRYGQLNAPIPVQAGDTMSFRITVSNGVLNGSWFGGQNIELSYLNGSITETGVRITRVNDRTTGIFAYIQNAEINDDTLILDLEFEFLTTGTIVNFAANENGLNSFSGAIGIIEINTASNGAYRWPLDNELEVVVDTYPESLQNGPGINLLNYASSLWTNIPFITNEAPGEESINDTALGTNFNANFDFGLPPLLGNSGTSARNLSGSYYQESLPIDYSAGFTVAYTVQLQTLASSSGVRSAGAYSAANSNADSRWTMIADNFDGNGVRFSFSILNTSTSYRIASQYNTCVEADVRSTFLAQTGQTYHIVATARPSNEIELWIDGVSQGVSPLPAGLVEGWTGDSRFFIGAPYLNGAWRAAESVMDNVRIIQRSVTDAEAQELFRREQL